MRNRRTTASRGRGRTTTKKEKPARRSSGKVVVHKPNLKRIRAQMKKLKARRGSYWKPDKGKNLIRILPPWSDAGFWYKDSLRHFMRPAEGGKMQTISCPTLDGERCAVCEYRAKLRESKSKAKQKTSDQLSPSLDFHVNMVDMKDQDSGVQTGRLTETVVNELLEYMMDPEWGDFTSPTKGFNVILTRTGEGMGTKYTVMLSRKQTRLKSLAWLKELKDLDELYPRSDYADTKKFLSQGEAEEEDEEEYEEDEELEDDEEVEEEEDDEEEDDDEEAEEEDEEDDDE